LESQTSNIINETEELTEKILSTEGDPKKKLTSRLHEILISLQEIKSEKLHYSQIVLEKVESKCRSLETDFQNDMTNKTEENTVKNASIVQQVLSHLPLKNSSKPGSVESSSKSASDSNNNSGNDRAKRTRRSRMETVEERVETPKPIKIESRPNVSLINSKLEFIYSFLSIFLDSKRESPTTTTNSICSGQQCQEENQKEEENVKQYE
jgi:Inhibitor of growth proteins N-terminal histone-binding